MAPVFPVREGFRTAIYRPAVVLAEVAWRWTFGAAALVLTAAALALYLRTLPVSNIELLIFHGHPRFQLAAALAHAIQGGAGLLRVVAILIPAVSALWIVAGSIGRAATLKALLPQDDRVSLAPQFGLNFLRAGMTLASAIAYLGAAIASANFSFRQDVPRPGVFLAIFLLLVFGITMVRSRVNWFLYLGAIFAARDRRDTMGSIADAAALFRRYPGAFIGTGAIFGVLHGFIFVIALTVALAVSGSSLPRIAVAVLLSGITLFYCAVCDFLYIARLAGYVALYEGDRTPPPAPVQAVPVWEPPRLPLALPPAPEPGPQNAG